MDEVLQSVFKLKVVPVVIHVAAMNGLKDLRYLSRNGIQYNLFRERESYTSGNFVIRSSLQ